MLKPKQIKYIKSRLDGNSQEQAGLDAGAETAEAARKLATRMSKSVQVQQALQQAQEITLVEAGITKAAAYKPISEALQATKIVSSHTEPDYEVPDHAIRLRASDMSLKLLKENQAITAPQNNTQLTEALNDDKVDEIQLMRVLKNQAN